MFTGLPTAAQIASKTHTFNEHDIMGNTEECRETIKKLDDHIPGGFVSWSRSSEDTVVESGADDLWGDVQTEASNQRGGGGVSHEFKNSRKE